MTPSLMKKKLANDDIKASLFFQCPLIHPSIALRKNALLKNNICYNTSVKVSEDYILYADLLGLGLFANIPEPLIYYRIHEQQTRITSHLNSEGIIKGRMIAWRKMLSLLKLETTDQVLIVHDKITYYRNLINDKDAPFIQQYIQLLGRMEEANKRLAIFEKRLFGLEISSRLYSTMLHSKIPPTVAVLWMFKYGSHLTFENRLKLPINKMRRWVLKIPN